MATRSRARMFHATARALRTAADQRIEDGEHVFSAEVEDVEEHSHTIDSPALILSESAIDQETLQVLHAEFRWAESKLAQSSERLAEAQEARRKDLVALACMRRELRSSFDAERAYIHGQSRLFNDLLPKLRTRENELADLVAAGAPTAPVIRDLAIVRSERKLYDLAIVQAQTQLSRIDDNDCTLEYEVANEAYDTVVNGQTMRELARLRTAQSRAKRMSVQAGKAARTLLDALEVDTTFGEVTAVGSFLAAEFEGDLRAHQRLERVRERQISYELTLLPEPASGWKGILHPVSWIRAKRIASS